jgi:hypothetical protein
MTYLGESQNGHFPPKCSQSIAVNRSRDPRIALWTMIGRLKPGLRGISYQVNFCLSFSSGGKYFESSFFSSLGFPATAACSSAAFSA